MDAIAATTPIIAQYLPSKGPLRAISLDIRTSILRNDKDIEDAMRKFYPEISFVQWIVYMAVRDNRIELVNAILNEYTGKWDLPDCFPDDWLSFSKTFEMKKIIMDKFHAKLDCSHSSYSSLKPEDYKLIDYAMGKWLNGKEQYPVALLLNDAGEAILDKYVNRDSAIHIMATARFLFDPMREILAKKNLHPDWFGYYFGLDAKPYDMYSTFWKLLLTAAIKANNPYLVDEILYREKEKLTPDMISKILELIYRHMSSSIIGNKFIGDPLYIERFNVSGETYHDPKLAMASILHFLNSISK